MKFHLVGGVKLPNPKKEFFEKSKQLVSQFLLVGVMLAMIPTGVIAAPVLPTAPLLPFDASASRIQFDAKGADPVIAVALPAIAFTIGESNAQAEARQAAAAARAVQVTKTATAASVTAVDPDLATKRALVQRAAAAYNIPWQVLEAVWQVESGKSWDTATRSSAGAQGPAQFLPSTWRRYGVDANGDGVADINSAEDAVYGAAHYLAANGADRGQVYDALLAYNHADWYVQKVLRIARDIGYAA